MSFMNKIKKIFGIGGVKMNVSVPGNIEKSSSQISGSITLTTKTDQYIQELEVKVCEEWSTGRGENKEAKTFVLGEIIVDKEFEIKADQSKTFKFTCPFEILKSKNDRLKEGGKVSSTLGKMGSLMDNEKSKYTVDVSCDVKGVLMSPSESIDIKMV